MLDFEKRLQSIGQQTVLCVGDLMLDDFVYGEVGRISPEAPAPVLAVKRNEVAIGGGRHRGRHNPAPRARRLFFWFVGGGGAGGGVLRPPPSPPPREPPIVVRRTTPAT